MSEQYGASQPEIPMFSSIEVQKLLNEIRSLKSENEGLRAELKRKTEALEKIAKHKCKGEIAYDQFAYKRMEQSFKKIAKEALQPVETGKERK